MKKIILFSTLTLTSISILSTHFSVSAETTSSDTQSTYYQRTPAFNNPYGKIDLSKYTQSELAVLTSITHGNEYHGNTSIDKVATEHVYTLDDDPLSNFLGKDGVLQLYNESTFMTNNMVEKAAEYWNRLANKKIVEVVNSQTSSDEVIHDSNAVLGNLGGQTYNGNGILFYPKQWGIGFLSSAEQNNWKEATLIHEIGHALGIPHLGGGVLGLNQQNAGLYGTEFMAAWATGIQGAPIENSNGVKSTSIDAAVLSLAGLSWENPQKIADWILTQNNGYVNYNNGLITSNLPYGIEIDFKGNYIQSKTSVNKTLTVLNNYNVYKTDDSILDQGYGYIPLLKNLTTTKALGIIGSKVNAVAYYTSTKGNPYYKVLINGNEYIINSAAFKE